jgi:hypothetical protein
VQDHIIYIPCIGTSGEANHLHADLSENTALTNCPPAPLADGSHVLFPTCCARQGNSEAGVRPDLPYEPRAMGVKRRPHRIAALTRNSS